MAPEPISPKKLQEERAANIAQADAAHREAYDYWGYLFKEDKCGTDLLGRLLKGIAEVISKKFEPGDSPDLTPSQIAAWYRSVGGDYDVLFTDTPPSSVAFIYRSLGAYHSLQPGPYDDGYSSPTIPALKKNGFVTWQTIQLLLGPEEHVPFLQRAVEIDDIPDPETGNIFPKILPKECFPEKPDDAMEMWYQSVAARLKKEADEEASGGSAADEPKPRTSTDSEGTSADEKHGAYRYFEDPLYRMGRPRPTFMRHVSKQSPRPGDDHGRAVTSRVRHMLNPLNYVGSRKKSIPGRYSDEDYSDEDATPIAPGPQPGARYPSNKRPHPPRRESSLSTTDSDSDPDRPPSRRREPVLRSHRSHEPPVSQPGYFPAYSEARRFSNQHDAVRMDGRSSSATSPQPVYRPTTSPLFATQVAQAQREAAQKYYVSRPAMPPRTSYRPVPAPGVRWGPQTVHPVSPPRDGEPPYVHERERERDRDRERHHRDRDPYEMGNSRRGSHRRHSEDVEYPGERTRDSARTRSHDRIKDEWDDRHDSDRDRDRKAGYDDNLRQQGLPHDKHKKQQVYGVESIRDNSSIHYRQRHRDVVPASLDLPEMIRDNLEYREVYGSGPVWTITSSEDVLSEDIPLRISGHPVVVPVDYRYPAAAYTIPPPDPRHLFIDASKDVSEDIVNDIFETYNDILGFYLLINGMLQLIIPEDFDIENALSRRPNEFGGLKVSYIHQSIVPTAESQKGTFSTSLQESFNVEAAASQHTRPSHSLHVSDNTSMSSEHGKSRDGSMDLKIGSLVRACLEGLKAADLFQGKIGLMTESNGQNHVVIPTHILTEALMATRSDRFPGDRWIDDMVVVASSGGQEIGHVTKTFDPLARRFPYGFEHDVSLVEIRRSGHLNAGIKSPLPTKWLSQNGWNNIKYTSQSLFLLDKPDLQTKNIELMTSQYQMVGQAVFKIIEPTEQKTRFRFHLKGKKSDSQTSAELWTGTVARSVLYRVNSSSMPPGALSGTAVCIREELEDGTLCAEVAGFSSWAQPAAYSRFDMDGPKLYSRLEDGRVAFFGAFQAPPELREHHRIV
ncbi:unnamed protein product [Alternaria alternata]